MKQNIVEQVMQRTQKVRDMNSSQALPESDENDPKTRDNAPDGSLTRIEEVDVEQDGL